MSLAVGTALGPYEITGLLGAGGMGEVYRARDSRLQRDVAIKIVAAGTTTDADRLARFEQEARATAALNHPNIVAVFNIGQSEHGPYIVSELLDGETQRERLGRGRVPVRAALDMAVQVTRGLAAAHDRGIVHRDLKPDNIFITKDGHAKILDFGLAKLKDTAPPIAHAETVATVQSPARTGPGILLGTVGYMSPEQVRGTKTLAASFPTAPPPSPWPPMARWRCAARTRAGLGDRLGVRFVGSIAAAVRALQWPDSMNTPALRSRPTVDGWPSARWCGARSTLRQTYGSSVDVSVSNAGAFQAGIPRRLVTIDGGLFNWDVTADGQRIIAIVEDETGMDATQQPLRIIQNWQPK